MRDPEALGRHFKSENQYPASVAFHIFGLENESDQGMSSFRRVVANSVGLKDRGSQRESCFISGYVKALWAHEGQGSMSGQLSFTASEDSCYERGKIKTLSSAGRMFPSSPAGRFSKGPQSICNYSGLTFKGKWLMGKELAYQLTAKSV